MTGCRYGAKNTLLKNYLGLAESAGAQVHPMTTVTSFEQRSDGAVGGPDRAHRSASCAAQATHLHRHQLILAAGTYGTQKLLFKMRDTRQAAQAVGQARRAHPHQLRVDRRRGPARGARRSRPHPRRGDHVVDPPDRRHPHRTVPLRQGIQRDGPAADADDRRRRARAAPTCRAGGSCSTRPREDPQGHAAAAQPAPLERAHDDRAGDAAPGQLDHDLHHARPSSASA